MALSNDFLAQVQSSNLPTGVIILAYGQNSLDVVIERYNSGSAAWDEVGYITDCKDDGSQFVDLLPLDGVTRSYRGKYVEPSAADGPYTAVVTATPVVLDELPSGVGLPALAIRTEQIGNEDGVYEYSCRVVDPLPVNPITVTLIGTNVALQYDSITTTSNTLFTFTITPTSTGAGRVTIRATSVGRTEGIDAIDIPAQDDTRAAVVEINGSQVNSTGLPYFAFRAPANSRTVDVEVWVTEELSAPSATQSVSYDVVSRRGYQIPQSPFTRTNLTQEKIWTTTILSSKSASWLTVSLVPVDGNGIVGTVINTLYPIPSTAVSAPNAITSTTVSTTSTTTTNSVTMPASNLPTSIRVYRDGVIYGPDITVTAGASATQNITHTDLTPNTLYVWEYAPVNASGAGAKTTGLSVTTSTQQLDAPTGAFAGLVNNKVRFTITDIASFPVGTTFAGDYEIGGSWLTLNTISSNTLESVETYSSGADGTARFRASNTNYITSTNSTPISFSAGGNLV